MRGEDRKRKGEREGERGDAHALRTIRDTPSQLLLSFFFWLPQMLNPMINPITANIKKINTVNFTYSEDRHDKRQGRQAERETDRCEHHSSMLARPGRSSQWLRSVVRVCVVGR